VSHDRDFLDRIATEILFAEGDGTWTAYAGGYSDMVRQRGSGVTAAAVAVKAAFVAGKAERAAGAKRKLSFKDQRALDLLPGKIEALRARLVDLEAQLARSPGADKVQALSAQYAAAKAEIDAGEEEWLRLETMREALEGR
jgi:ATP-binding cassette subfamily F protein uup